MERNHSKYSMENDINAIKSLVNHGANIHSQEYVHLQKKDGRSLLTRLLLGKKTLFQDSLRYLIDIGVDAELPDTASCSFLDYVDGVCDMSHMTRSNYDQRRIEFKNFIQEYYPHLLKYPALRTLKKTIRDYRPVIYVSWYVLRLT